MDLANPFSSPFDIPRADPMTIIPPAAANNVNRGWCPDTTPLPKYAPTSICVLSLNNPLNGSDVGGECSITIDWLEI